MDRIIEINREHVFSLTEAQEILPVIFRITKAYSQKVDSLLGRLEGISRDAAETITDIENQVSALIQEWQNKVQKLGALPKGLWIADLDAGDGYYCWKFPEREVQYWHRYDSGFSKRVLVENHRRPISLQDRLKNKIFRLSPLHLPDPAAVPTTEA